MKIFSYIQKGIALALVVFSLSFIYQEFSYAADIGVSVTTSGVSIAQANVGDSITSDKRSGQFSVPANLEQGVLLVNQTNEEVSVEVTVDPKQTWSAGPDTPNGVNAEGYPNWPQQETMKYPGYTAFALVAVNNSDPDDIRQIGVASGFTLPASPNGAFSFLMNDKSGLYNDNNGSLTVNWYVIENPNI